MLALSRMHSPLRHCSLTFVPLSGTQSASVEQASCAAPAAAEGESMQDLVHALALCSPGLVFCTSRSRLLSGYLSCEAHAPPDQRGALPTENMAGSAALASSSVHGTSDGCSEQCSCAEKVSLPAAHLGCTGTAASYCTPSASMVHTRMVLASYWGMP